MTIELPPLEPVPEDIEDHIKRLLQYPGDPDIGLWLDELIKYSGHMSTGDDMRWRLLCIVWLAMEYDAESGWQYLQWLNMREPQISAHLSEILIEAIDNLDAHVRMACWLAQTEDERLQIFFQDFYPIPAQRRIPAIMARLLIEPTRLELGYWLEMFCAGTVDNTGVYMRPWRLLAAAWYAAQFDPERGLYYLKLLTDGAPQLSAADNKLLMEATEEAYGMAALTEMIATCPHAVIQTMFEDFGHPNLVAIANSTLESEPDYAHLSEAVKQVETDVATFQRHLEVLRQAGLEPGAARILNMACGPLAEQTLLLSSAGYDVVGVDSDIPPKHLPLIGVMQWLKRRRHHRAWEEATTAYYQALAKEAGLALSWKKAEIKMGELIWLEDEADHSFEAIVCVNYLQHAPNVPDLLAESDRLLKADGLLLANIRPYTSLTGAFQVDPSEPWGHLRPGTRFFLTPVVPLNRWRAAQFREAIEAHFTIEQWQFEPDPHMEKLLTPEIEAELSDYSREELTCRQIFVVARRRS